MFNPDNAGLRYELLDYPPYYSNLAPSDYFLYTDSKKYLCKKRFDSNTDLSAQKMSILGTLQISLFVRGQKMGKTLDEKYEAQKM